MYLNVGKIRSVGKTRKAKKRKWNHPIMNI